MDIEYKKISNKTIEVTETKIIKRIKDKDELEREKQSCEKYLEEINVMLSLLSEDNKSL